MNVDQAPYRVAIIGMGPRGTAAIEALIQRTRSAETPLSIEGFDPTPWPGAGPNFDPEQSPLCLLNIPIRAVSIDPPVRDNETGNSFADWLAQPVDGERFPARAELGAYLNARFHRQTEQADDQSTVTHHQLAAVRLDQTSDGRWEIETERARFGPFDDVLLTLGQPQTAPDPQLARWQDHAEARGLDLMSAYPANDLLKCAENWAGETVGIRGLGLSTLDVVRLLTFGMGGRFEAEQYHPSGKEPARIMPFSLDGHAPVSKPADARIDQRFDPTDDECVQFRAAVESAVAQAPTDAQATLCAAAAGPALRILQQTDSSATADDVDHWLAVERDNPGSQETRSTTMALKSGIEMAHGRIPPSPGYAIGQLWRKWQAVLRKTFNHAAADPETVKAIIDFSEGLKRFSYGPPVASSEELLALIEAGIVDPRAAEDPKIKLVDDGWQIIEDDVSARVSAMVDGVLPSPSLDAITNPLVAGLAAKGRLQSVAEGLAVQTRKGGEPIHRDGSKQTGLSVLGRLALGSVISVDSIHDCFGGTTDDWADAVAARIRAKTQG